MSSPLDEPDPIQVPLSVDGSELLVFDAQPPGWARYWGPAEDSAIVQVRFGVEDTTGAGPIAVRELHVAARTDSGEAFSSGFLRTLPFQRMVAALNRPAVGDQVRRFLAGPHQTQLDSRRRGSRYLVPPASRATVEQPQLRLEVPRDRQRRPDSFYALVADTYLAQATLSNRAAQDLAEANAVPKSTVHRWLKEARTRGLLRLPQPTDPAVREA